MPTHESNSGTKIYNNVRFSNRIDTEENWLNSDAILAEGETAFVGDNGSYYMVVGDNHHNPMSYIVSDPDAHASHIFFPGRHGGGGGADYELPIATASRLGGVKIPNAAESGLNIDENGFLKNALFSSFNAEENRWVIDRLHVNDLSFNSEHERTSFSGNDIVLRVDATEELSEQETSGIIVNKIKDDVQGYLGIDCDNRIVINNYGYKEFCVPISAAEAVGFVNVSATSPVATVMTPTNLYMTRGSTPFAYYSPLEGLTIETYEFPEGGNVLELIPGLNVNGQPIPYDVLTNSYSIELEGGLTEESAAKLANLDVYIEELENLKDGMISEISDGEKITTAREGNNVTISHATTNTERPSSTVDNYIVQESQQGGALEVFTYISDIEVDEFGHVTKIIRKSVTFTTPPTT